MAGSIGDINSGLVGVSHTTGNEYQAMPSKSAIRPAVNTSAADAVHISKALSVDDSKNKLMGFVRGDRLQSYTPQDNRELRSGIINMVRDQLSDMKLPEDDRNALNGMLDLLKQDSELEAQATMARNILIPA
ncbi:hypothetical protein [Parendozoicomonas sp. Alg238-R29]|uniref:hypothetical protein n=1 Tax=Parendozoicomonas sp. Alg238-R29 TaxID=2993446 RepID=UPI00248DD04F|nr:hypothetical protein [Parendozoicomonas sp. Alg238-R29]